MNRPIDLEETDTAVAPTPDCRVDEVAFTLRHEESGFFEFVWPHFANDCSRLLAGELLCR